MKTVNSILNKRMQDIKNQDNRIVHYYASSKGYMPIVPPVFSCDFECPSCGSKDFLLHLLDKDHMCWFCKTLCAGSRLPLGPSTVNLPSHSKRSLEWPLFCEINGIGDIHHDVRFEKIHQSQKMLQFLLEFALHPFSIILMQGDSGSGKTYASMGICEFFTRKSSSAIFSTQPNLMYQWIEAKKESLPSSIIGQVKNCSLLVIDDFGTGDIPPGFMTYFMELINFRMQWKDKGTIISTNLDDDTFSRYCKTALNDRIKMGTKLFFPDKSRRQLQIR